MKSLMIVLFVLSSIMLTAQNTIVWKGGTPGNETKWGEARNWSGQQIPDEFSLVIIKNNNSGHYAQPIIINDVRVAGIEIQASASLTVSMNAILLIDGKYTYSEGLVIYGGTFINHGVLLEKNIDKISKVDSLAQVTINKNK